MFVKWNYICPYIDELHIKCSECGKVMNRVTDVMDVWFDSGSMPYAQFHYPFENKELFESQFPADFIAEGLDKLVDGFTYY